MKFVPNSRCYSCLLLLLLGLSLSFRSVLSSSRLSSSGGNTLPTPIPRWQESWTASQAHGTALAMVVKDCLVIFLRSPSTNVYRPFLPSNEESTEVYGLALEQIEQEHLQTFLSFAPQWFPVGSDTLCSMTGLGLDVEHICRVLQKRVEDHRFVYQTSMTTHSMVQAVASVLQKECLLKGSRPYGVQCLLVGCDDIESNGNSRGGPCLYSIDPTGSWQSWGRATAIGKFGTDVRRILAKKLKGSPSSTETLEKAVECLFECWKETCKDQGIGDTNDKDDCEVLVLRKDENNRQKTCLYRVSAEEIDRIMDGVESRISSTTNSQ